MPGRQYRRLPRSLRLPRNDGKPKWTRRWGKVRATHRFPGGIIRAVKSRYKDARAPCGVRPLAAVFLPVIHLHPPNMWRHRASLASLPGGKLRSERTAASCRTPHKRARPNRLAAMTVRVPIPRRRGYNGFCLPEHARGMVEPGKEREFPCLISDCLCL